MSDPVGGRISKTHEEGRAVDVSIKGFSEFHLRRLPHFLNTRFGKDWGTNKVGSNDLPRVCVVHDAGSGNHIHLQVKRNIYLEID